jgi:Uma2 family endonuclease
VTISELDSLVLAQLPLSQRGSPTWELALNYPRQGEWTEDEYLSLDTNRLVEFTDGVLEFLPMPKPSHARLSRFISDLLRGYVASKSLGDVFWAPFSIRISPTKLREPDIVYLCHDRIPRDDVPPSGADLVVEVVSEGTQNRDRDLRVKRQEYASAGIPEYWIVDPEAETITVLTLAGQAYAVHGEFHTGTWATSVLLSGFQVDVTAAFAASKPFSK